MSSANLDEQFKGKIQLLDNLKVGLKFKGKQRFKFNFLLENGIQRINKTVRANPRREWKMKKDFSDFNTWVESLDEYVKTASCGIYSVKKIRTIERSENWLLFKVHLFSGIDALKFFRSISRSNKSTANQGSACTAPARRPSCASSRTARSWTWASGPRRSPGPWTSRRAARTSSSRASAAGFRTKS